MTTDTTPKTPLDGLLICGACSATMTLTGGPNPRYACRRECGTPQFPAEETDRVLIGEILRVVLTERNTATILDAANNELGSQGEAGHTMTREDVEDLTKRPDLLLRAADGPGEVRDLLGRFIAEIRTHEDRAVVHYGIPLPADSVLPGKDHQEIPWPSGLPA